MRIRVDLPVQFVEDIQGLPAVVSGHNGMALFFEQSNGDFAVHRVIFHEQHFHRRSGGAHDFRRTRDIRALINVLKATENGRFDFALIQRLRHAGVNTERSEARGIGHLTGGAEHNDDSARQSALGLHAFRNLKSTDAWHFRVEQYQLKWGAVRPY